ncbi:MAG: hypothetical protein H6737_14150 [Alphaproteobacteria bacterium]|nr:hypothetical protein [Alphaproteobacteria bacterium]
MLPEPFGTVVEGVLLAPLFLVAASLGAWVLYRGTWEGRDWMEAVRDQHRPWMWLERWIRFRWIHPDCQYWVLPVRLDRGPIEVEGRAPEGLWWCLTWYAHTEVNASLASHEVELDGAGGYRIRIAAEGDGPLWIPTRPGVKHAVLSLRIYEPAHPHPIWLPRVTQGGRVLSHGGAR